MDRNQLGIRWVSFDRHLTLDDALCRGPVLKSRQVMIFLQKLESIHKKLKIAKSFCSTLKIQNEIAFENNAVIFCYCLYEQPTD